MDKFLTLNNINFKCIHKIFWGFKVNKIIFKSFDSELYPCMVKFQFNHVF